MLQSILKVKSDDVVGRVTTYGSIIKGNNVSEPGIPEAFKVLLKELQSLSLDMKVLTEDNEEVQIKDLIEGDLDLDMPARDKREYKEEVDLFTSQKQEDGQGESAIEDEEDFEDVFEFNSKDLFDDEDDGVLDTTVPTEEDMDFDYEDDEEDISFDDDDL